MCFLEILVLKFINKNIWKILHLGNGQPVYNGDREGRRETGEQNGHFLQKFYKTIGFLRRRSRESTFWLGQPIPVLTSCKDGRACCGVSRRSPLRGATTPPRLPQQRAPCQASLRTQGWEARQGPAPRSSSLLSFWLHGLGVETFRFKNHFR